MDEVTVSKEKVDAAVARLSQAGRLSPSSYTAIFQESFQTQFFPLGVTKRQVEEALHQPDDYQHLMTERSPKYEDNVFSLFMKWNGGRKGQDPNWLLVQSYRRGLEQIPQSAWRIYPTEIDLSQAAAPLDVLKAFVEKFGTMIELAGHKGKFIESASVSKELAAMGFGLAFKFESEGPNINYFNSWSFRHTTDPTMIDVGIAYCINLNRYRSNLISHGVSVG
jgi:hypothetical protein